MVTLTRNGSEIMNAPLIPVHQDSDLLLYKVVVGPVDNNVYIVQCAQTGVSALIDAANEPERLLEYCQFYKVGLVLETHGHWDHIAAVPAVRDAGYSVAISKQDSSMLDGYDRIIGQDDQIEIGNLRIDVIHTPGHTPGSLTYHVRNTKFLLTGDTLFPGGPGATRFPGGDFKAIIESIDSKIFATYSPETVILPGHGTSTTIATELPHFNSWIARGW